MSLQVGCFARLKIYEENARFILLSIVVFVYLLFGATIFRYLERDQELLEREDVGHSTKLIVLLATIFACSFLRKVTSVLDVPNRLLSIPH